MLPFMSSASSLLQSDEDLDLCWVAQHYVWHHMKDSIVSRRVQIQLLRLLINPHGSLSPAQENYWQEVSVEPHITKKACTVVYELLEPEHMRTSCIYILSRSLLCLLRVHDTKDRLTGSLAHNTTAKLLINRSWEHRAKCWRGWSTQHLEGRRAALLLLVVKSWDWLKYVSHP